MRTPMFRYCTLDIVAYYTKIAVKLYGLTHVEMNDEMVELVAAQSALLL